MKKFIVMALILMLSATCLFGTGGCTKRENTLIVCNWADYMDEDILPEFEKYYYEQTGKKIKVDYRALDTNEIMLQQLLEGGEDFDVMCPSDYAIEKLISSNALSKITRENITNYSKIDPTTLGLAFDKNNEYSIPYMWGTLGILYNTKYVTEAELDQAGFGILWNSINKAELNGKILMKDSVRDVLVAAALYANQSELRALEGASRGARAFELINMKSDADYNKVREKLLALPDNLSWEVDSGKDDIINGVAYVNLAWSGDAVYAMEESDEPLAYYVPTEGSNIWVDSWVIPNKAVNKTAAEMFIDYLLRPEIAVRNMSYIGYTSAVSSQVLKDAGLINDEFIANLTQYPSEDIINRCAVMEDFGSRTEQISQLWTEARYS